jgi:hypothetical protein
VTVRIPEHPAEGAARLSQGLLEVGDEEQVRPPNPYR